jgi:D-alanyl-D-alanine carboxypeptidase (penicillin-binding protein 5/6)
MKISLFSLFSIVTFLLAVSAFYLGVTFNISPQILVNPLVNSTSAKLKMADNVWFPKEVKGETIDAGLSDITAEAAFFVETTSGEVLFAKNADEQLPIASLTKIMTAIVALEKMPLDKEVLISESAAGMEPDKMFLEKGEKLTVEELINGLFLVSANDASEALAESTTGRREEFLQMMNTKAKHLGMKNTHFINPSGLQEDGISQYSTALDVSLMAHYAIANFPFLLDITKEPHIYIPENGVHSSFDLYSGINLVSTYPGVLGFKTGYTPEAGLTLVTVARREGKEVIGVLLGCTNRRDDAKRLLDYSFQKLGMVVE